MLVEIMMEDVPASVEVISRAEVLAPRGLSLTVIGAATMLPVVDVTSA